MPSLGGPSIGPTIVGLVMPDRPSAAVRIAVSLDGLWWLLLSTFNRRRSLDFAFNDSGLMTKRMTDDRACVSGEKRPVLSRPNVFFNSDFGGEEDILGKPRGRSLEADGEVEDVINPV